MKETEQRCLGQGWVEVESVWNSVLLYGVTVLWLNSPRAGLGPEQGDKAGGGEAREGLGHSHLEMSGGPSEPIRCPAASASPVTLSPAEVETLRKRPWVPVAPFTHMQQSWSGDPRCRGPF